MLEGCDHCGYVKDEGSEHGVGNCPECGRPLRQIDAGEARVLSRERRIAEQFRRTSRLIQAVDARRGLRFS
jgi:predicted  nucleic acid-binding Zn-ribbon protein